MTGKIVLLFFGRLRKVFRVEKRARIETCDWPILRAPHLCSVIDRMHKETGKHGDDRAADGTDRHLEKQ